VFGRLLWLDGVSRAGQIDGRLNRAAGAHLDDVGGGRRDGREDSETEDGGETDDAHDRTSGSMRGGFARSLRHRQPRR